MTNILYFKFIPNALYRSDAVEVKFLADLADMYINGAVAYDHFGSPNLV